jgi:hypothetical protein
MVDTEAPEVMAGDDVPDRSARRTFWFGTIVASAFVRITQSVSGAPALVKSVSNAITAPLMEAIKRSESFGVAAHVAPTASVSRTTNLAERPWFGAVRVTVLAMPESIESTANDPRVTLFGAPESMKAVEDITLSH